ncbi:SGNH/GDSL hydrolase family protein [Carboxylicivirga sp. M1479]|uniref:SGNH/GDSL hydrolase family protein n=1 Tax=Carboxylicivirga sp. M1479 TaxID=2594476 RepID=UPI001177EA0C|nr:SGNH/GDSL hydrolase family protein [Carboxylicivirga sp. M1479]TRX71777.1 electron transporter RnfD [Carboxylicivirga sp. M1479]
MLHKKILFLLLLLPLSLTSAGQKKSLVIDYTNKKLKYSGRIDYSSGNSADLLWSGSSIKFNFEGEAVSGLLRDHKDQNYYNLILDDDSIIVFNPGTEKKFYTLVSGLSKGRHTLEIFKRTEWGRGKTSFYQFKIEGNAKLLRAPEEKKRKIEFYGNSITAGYGNEDLEADRPDSTFTNNYKSYAAITARHFDAEYSCIAKGGIGIMLSWFNFTMPQLYDRFAPNDDSGVWNFKQYKPQVVVINLFQNDSWLVKKPERKEFKATFGSTPPDERYIINAYKEFVSSIRSKYPKASIICALGSMDATKEGSPWPGYVQAAVEEMNDQKLFTLVFPYKNTQGHPKVHEHEVMAKHLVAFIEENVKW